MSESRPAPVLLIHGQPGGAHDWDRVKAAVGSRAELITVARPGWTAGTRPADLAGNAAAALAALDAREIPRATVAGHSFGGAVAAWLAASHPDRVARLVLAAPAASRASLVPLDYWLAWPVAGDLLSAASLSVAALALRPRELRRRLSSLLRVDERYLGATSAAVGSPRAWRAFAADQRALVGQLPQLEGMLDRIVAPTTIVAGSADRVVPLTSAGALAREIPGARLVVLEGAGHLLLQHEAARLAEIIVGA